MRLGGFRRPLIGCERPFNWYDLVLFDEPIEVMWKGERDRILGFMVTFLPRMMWGGLVAGRVTPRVLLKEDGSVGSVGRLPRVLDYDRYGVVFTSPNIACVLVEPEPVVMVGRYGEEKIECGEGVHLFRLARLKHKFRIREGVRILAEVPIVEGIEGLRRAVERLI